MHLPLKKRTLIAGAIAGEFGVDDATVRPTAGRGYGCVAMHEMEIDLFLRYSCVRPERMD